MAKFGKTDFLDFSAVLSRAYRNSNGWARFGVLTAAEAIADVLQKSNRGFNREHFIAVVQGLRPIGPPPLVSKETANDRQAIGENGAKQEGLRH